ncbi:MAG: restriction endonuclease subunit S [Elusimicrobiota bacterium]
MKTNTETKFKQTEIGKIPYDWEVVRLGDVVSYFLGRTPARKELKYWSQKNEGIPWVSISDMKPFSIITDTEKKLTKDAVKIMPQISRKGTLIMSFKLTVGRTSILGIDAYHNEAIISIYPRENILKEFLLYYLPKVNYSILQDRAVKGQTLNKSKIDNILVIVPPLEEQKKIAGVLSKIQEAIENQRKIIEKLEELKKSTMDKLFKNGLYGKETKQTEIGEIPYDWEVVRLGDVCDTTSGGTPYRNISKYFGGNIPWVKSGELKDYDILDTEEKISEEGLKNSSAKILEKGTLLVAMYGATVGKTGILGIKAATNQAICAILPKNSKTVFNKFIQYFLIKNRNFLIRERYGGAQPNISQQVIKNLSIPLPPLEEQKKIAEILSKIDNMKEEAEKKLDYLNEFFNSALDLLITGKVRLN